MPWYIWLCTGILIGYFITQLINMAFALALHRQRRAHQPHRRGRRRKATATVLLEEFLRDQEERASRPQ